MRRLLVANPYRSTPIQWARRLIGQRPVPFPVDVSRSLVEPRRLRRRDPASVRALERVYHAYDRILESAAADLGAHRPAIITTSPFVAGFPPLRWASWVTFYAWDDFSDRPRRIRRWCAACERRSPGSVTTGRAVVGVSQAILDRIQPTGARALVPNGVAPDEWRRPGEPPAWFAELRSPRILYVGALSAERIDVEALSETAARFPHGSSCCLDRLSIGRPWIRCADTRMFGFSRQWAVRRSASVIHAADVCVMPHRLNRMTMAMNPLKSYKYLAGGRPVAASDSPAGPGRGSAHCLRAGGAQLRRRSGRGAQPGAAHRA